jgi:hypothetical protein
MRIRSVKPDFWRDRDTTGRWPADMKLLYVGLWNVADDEGRLEIDLDLLAADLDPFRVTWPDLAAVIERIRATGCLIVYEADGKKFGFIPSFKAHQHPSKPSPSRLPAPPAQLPERSRKTPGALPAGEEGKGEEREGNGAEQRATVPAPEATDPGTPAAPPTPEAGAKPAPAPRERKTGLVSAAEQMTRPFAVQLHSLLAETWPDIGYAAGEPAMALDRACQEHGGTAAFAVACREFAQRKGVEPGSTKWFAACLKDIGRPKAEQPRGRKAMGVVGSNWEEPGF